MPAPVFAVGADGYGVHISGTMQHRWDVECGIPIVVLSCRRFHSLVHKLGSEACGLWVNEPCNQHDLTCGHKDVEHR